MGAAAESVSLQYTSPSIPLRKSGPQAPHPCLDALPFPGLLDKSSDVSEESYTVSGAAPSFAQVALPHARGRNVPIEELFSSSKWKI